MLEYINTIYVLPLIATIIGLIIVYIYDKFEKKQYTSALYIRIGLLIYFSAFGSFYISELNIFKNLNFGNKQIHQTGGSSSYGESQSMMPQANDIKLNNNNNNNEFFKTGVSPF